MSDIIIRDPKPEDVDEAARIAVAAYTSIFAMRRSIMAEELFGALHKDPLAGKERQVRSACAGDNGAMVYIAELEGQVVGFVTFYVNLETGVGEIGDNAVDPAVQGKGIGPMMYERVLQRFRELGMRFAEVGTGLDPSHAPARRAYEKAGFNIALPLVRYFQKV